MLLSLTAFDRGVEAGGAHRHVNDAISVSTIGIDTGKNTLHLIGLDQRGTIVLREKVARGRIAARLANVPQCLIGIEAGMATHYVARELSALGHDVKQVPPAYAKPFRQGHENDFRDAHAIAEAVQRPSTRCVPGRPTISSIYRPLQIERMTGLRTSGHPNRARCMRRARPLGGEFRDVPARSMVCPAACVLQRSHHGVQVERGRLLARWKFLEVLDLRSYNGLH